MNEYLPQLPQQEDRPKKNILKKAIRGALIGALRPFFRQEERLDGTVYISRLTMGGTPFEYFKRSRPAESPFRTTYKVKK